jgi:glycosyltransferase involved in cell wall biosynthesis
MNTPVLSVIIPCLNEEKSIAACVTKARHAMEKMKVAGEVLVVDNGSKDRSAELAEKAGARVVPHTVRGYGSALKRGIAEARGRYLIMADADNTYDFGEIPKFHRLLEEGADLVMGSRLRGKIERRAMPWLHRWVGTPVLTLILDLFFNARITDANCGMRGFTKTAMERLKLKCNGMEFASEMVVKAAQKRMNIKETPINYYAADPDRVPNLHTFRDGWRHLRFMPGLVLLLVGLGLSAALLLKTVIVFHVPLGLSAAMFANALVFMGLQVILFGVYAIIFNTSQGLMEEDRISRLVKKYFSLETGLVFGGLVLLAGLLLGGMTIGMLWQASTSMSQVDIPVTKLSVISIFMVLLGIQIIFSSFYLSLFNLTKTLQ